MAPPPDLADKKALSAALLVRIEALMATNGRLMARVAELGCRQKEVSRIPLPRRL